MKKEIQILTNATIEYDGDEDNAVFRALDSFHPTFDSIYNDVSVIEYESEEIDLKNRKCEETMIEAMNKLIFFNFNFHGYEEMIKYIVNGNENMYNHFEDKWITLYESVGCRSVMLSFYCELDTLYRRRMLEFIINNYNGEQKI